VTGGFDITKVSFGIERTLSGNLTAKSQPAEVSVYSYEGAVGGQTIDLTKVTLLPGAHLPITVHDTAAPMMLDIPLAATVPAAAAAVVLELHIPNGASDTTKNVFFIGATEVGAQTQPAYQRAPGCMEPTPVTIAATGFPGRFLIMQVTGRTGSAALAPGRCPPCGNRDRDEGPMRPRGRARSARLATARVPARRSAARCDLRSRAAAIATPPVISKLVTAAQARSIGAPTWARLRGAARTSAPDRPDARGARLPHRTHRADARMRSPFPIKY
jgi:hypothetical protein